MTNFPWRVALFVSLAVNLVVVSAVIGAFAAGARLERPDHRGGFSRSEGPRAFMDALPPEARRDLRRDLAGDVIANGEQRMAARTARLELYRVASAENYDAAQVRAAFARVREAESALQAPLHDALAQRLATLPTEQRRAAIEAMTDGPRGMMRRGDRHGRSRDRDRGPSRDGEERGPPPPSPAAP